MKSHKKFIIQTIPFNAELVGGLLWSLEIEGINETDNFLEAFASEESSVDLNEIRSLLENLKFNNLIESFTVLEEKIEEQNWNAEWEKSIGVIEVTDRLVIKPTFRDYNSKPGQIILQIDPKMSFGTGEHETTKLILKMLEKLDIKEKKVLDAGSGTGVLGIAAAKLGAGKVIAFDNDEWCKINGDENVILNELEEKVEIRFATIDQIPENEFDLVIANINKNILKDIYEDIIYKIAKGGTLILSGLLNTDKYEMINLYSKKLKFIYSENLGEWIALKFRNE